MDIQKDGWVERLEYVQMDRQTAAGKSPSLVVLLNPPINYSSGIALVSVSLGLQYSTDVFHMFRGKYSPVHLCA